MKTFKAKLNSVPNTQMILNSVNFGGSGVILAEVIVDGANDLT